MPFFLIYNEYAAYGQINNFHFFVSVFNEHNGAFDAINPLAIDLQKWNQHFSTELGKHKNQIFTDFLDEEGDPEWESQI